MSLNLTKGFGISLASGKTILFDETALGAISLDKIVVRSPPQLLHLAIHSASDQAFHSACDSTRGPGLDSGPSFYMI